METPVPAPSATLAGRGRCRRRTATARRSRHHRPDRDGEGTGPALSLCSRAGRRHPPSPRRQAAGCPAGQCLVPGVAVRPPPLATADRGGAAAGGPGCRHRLDARARRRGPSGASRRCAASPTRCSATCTRAIRDLPASTGAQEVVVNTAVEYLEGLTRESGDDPALLVEVGQGLHQGRRAGVLAVAAEPRTPRRRAPLPDAGARGARTTAGRAARRSAGRPGGGRARGGVGRLLPRDRPERRRAGGLRGGRPRRGGRAARHGRDPALLERLLRAYDSIVASYEASPTAMQHVDRYLAAAEQLAAGAARRSRRAIGPRRRLLAGRQGRRRGRAHRRRDAVLPAQQRDPGGDRRRGALQRHRPAQPDAGLEHAQPTPPSDRSARARIPAPAARRSTSIRGFAPTRSTRRRRRWSRRSGSRNRTPRATPRASISRWRSAGWRPPTRPGTIGPLPRSSRLSRGCASSSRAIRHVRRSS